MTDTRSALLAAVLAVPDDDTPRLVYADYLDEQGEGERAEFIRVQCELAKWETMPDGSCPACKAPVSNMHDDDCPRFPLRRREAELWNDSRLNGAPHPWLPVPDGIRIRNNWLSSYNVPDITIRPQVNYELESITFRFGRGFVGHIISTSAAWLTHGDAILRAHPVRTVRLTDRPRLEFRWAEGDGIAVYDRDERLIDTIPNGVLSAEAKKRPAGSPMSLIGELYFAHRWPGVRFELSPEPPTFVSEEIVNALEEEELRVLYGDPTASVPGGVIYRHADR